MPSEWQAHQATWLAWPHNASDWRGKLEAATWIHTELVRVLSRHETVNMLVDGPKEKARATRLLHRAGVDPSSVQFVRARTDRSWTRDFLPLFVTRARNHEPDTNGETAQNRIAAVKWRFNGWARWPGFGKDHSAGLLVARQLGMRTFQPVSKRGNRTLPVVLEGGAIDVDGEGTLLATEQCLLTGAHARNPWIGRAGMERAVRDYLGVKKVIWLSAGIDGDDTTGHVDDFVRFVAPGRVVLCEELNRRDANYSPLQDARRRLSNETDALGRRLEIVPLPMPKPVFFRGERVPASYANFYLANQLVLVPTFNDPSDLLALNIFTDLFAERAVIGIYCRDLVAGGGTIHCSTLQQPCGQP
jgi:agmatine deiminase